MSFVVMARIAAPFGVRGWVRIAPFTEKEDALRHFKKWRLAPAPAQRDKNAAQFRGEDSKNAAWREVALLEFKLHGRGCVAKLQGIDGRDDAEALRGWRVAVPRRELPPLEKGALYLCDLPGLQVQNTRGEHLGEVEKILDCGASPLLSVRLEQEGKGCEILIPLVENYVEEVNFERKIILVHWEKEWR